VDVTSELSENTAKTGGGPLRSARSLEFCLRKLHSRLSPCFARTEPRTRALNYMFGLAGISEKSLTGRRNVATYASEDRADGAQRLLTTAQWDDAGVRQKLREIARSASTEVGDFYLTELTFAKKGNRAVAVDLQFSAETGRAQNCQNAVALLFTTSDKQAFLLDIELYLPPAWAEDEGLRRRGSIPPGVHHRSRSAIATEMISRATASGFRPRRVYLSLNCVDKRRLLTLFQRLRMPYVTSLSSTESSQLAEQDPDTAIRDWPGFPLQIPANQGPPLAVTHRPDPAQSTTRRHGTRYFRTCTRYPLSSREMEHAIAELRQLEHRWRAVRGRAQLDRYEVRSWRGWHRHMTLAMAVQLAGELADTPDGEGPAPTAD
jgi:SRSO17 transposase